MPEFVAAEETRQKLALLGAFVAVAIGAALFAFSIKGEDITMLTALVGLVGFVVVFPFPKLAVVLVILFAQVQYLFTSPYGSLVSEPIFPITFQWLDEVILLSLLSNLTLTKLLMREAPAKAPAMLLLAVLFMVGVLSARINGIPLLTGLIAQRNVFEMVILYLAIVNMDLDERFLKGLVYLLLGIGVFQAMVGVLEFAGKYRLYMAGNHDIVQGTWGGGSANHIGIFFLCLSAIMLARLRRRWHGPTVMLLGVYVILLVLSSSRTGIVLAPLVFIFVLREKMKNPKYWIAAATVLVFLAACLSLYYRNTEAEADKDLGANEFAFQFSGRTGAIPVMSQVLRNNSRFPLFGAAPGTYLTAAGALYGSDMLMEVQAMMRTREVITPFISASYAVVWMEYGIFGLVLFVLILARFFFFAWKQERMVQSLFWKDYFRALQAIMLIYGIAGGVFSLWTHFQVNVYLWLFPAVGVRYAILRKREAVQAARVVSPETKEIPRRLAAPAPLG